MGAQNSKEQTVPINNPTPHVTGSIQMTPEVALRLTNEQRSQLYGQTQKFNNNNCHCKCASNTLQELTEQDALLYKSAVEMQEEEFAKTILNLERMFGKSMEWSQAQRNEADKLRSEVLQCYKQHTKEPLRCNQLTEDFQNYVFKQQMVNILKEQEQREQQEQQTEKPTQKCGGHNTATDAHVDTGIKVEGNCKNPSDPPDLQNVKHEWKQEEEIK